MGLPVYKLLGGAHKDHIVPYASLQPYGNSVKEYGAFLVTWSKRAKEYGCTAGKMECTLGGPYTHTGLKGTDEDTTGIIRACRETAGLDFKMMVDVQYLWYDAKSALRTFSKWEDLDIYFLETPLQIDSLEGYAILSKEAPMRIAAGEWQNTRFEFIELMDKGLIDVAQPDVRGVGGITKAVRVCQLAQDKGRLIVPHCWKTGIGIAAYAHLAVATPNCPMIEFLPTEICDSELRIELVETPLTMGNGVLKLSDAPGLGIELNMDTVEKYEVKDENKMYA